MNKFKIGQTVRILDNALARQFNLDIVGLIDTTITIEQFIDNDVLDGGQCIYVEQRWYVPSDACVLVSDAAETSPHGKTTFQRVAEMNTAFGNPKGDASNIDWDKIRSQFKSVFDEYCEGLTALGYHAPTIAQLRELHTEVMDEYAAYPHLLPLNEPDTEGFRDACADIKVFVDGASHLAGFDGDADMHIVVDAVMTRFIKDEADKQATQDLHAAKGVTEVYFEGEYPTMVMKSSVDQPDAPKGKFLKSASYSQPVFPTVG